MLTRWSIVAFCLTAVVSGATLSAADRPLPETVEFNRDVRSILSNNCLLCHGPDANHREADLRLDVEESAKAVKEGKAAIVPSKLAESELIRRITATDADERMPPADSGKSLTPRDIEILRRWVAQGAVYEKHWSLLPVHRVEPPAAADATATPIDRFLLARLQIEGIKPAPEADRRTLLRRLSYDLTGLPPTPREVEEFLADRSPQAYEKVVDRLLASPAYGERMANYWLDLVRFADTNGIHSDNHREHAPYRDYVIDAFNANLPFDRFTVEQLAGDLLPNPTNAQRIASGYNRLNLTTEEGGAQAKEYLAKYQADRVRNASTVWMAATMGCCECHTHKFDPYTIKDFYSFAAFFADVQETAVGKQQPVKIPSGQQEARVAEIDAELATLEKSLSETSPELAAAQAAWETEARAASAKAAPAWTPVKPTKLESAGKQTLTAGDDAIVLASGENPAKDTYTLTLPAEQAKITGVRLEVFTHEAFPNKGLARGNGNFVLTKFEVRAGDKPLKLASAVADYSQPSWDVAGAIDDNAQSGWAIDGHQKPANHMAVITLAEPLAAAPGTTLTIVMKHEQQFPQHNVGRFRLALTGVEKPGLEESSGPPASVLAALETAAEKRTPEQAAAVANYYRGIAPLLAPVRQKIAALQGERKRIVDSAPLVLITVAMAPRTVRVLARGNWLDDSGEVVAPAIPAVYGAVAAEGPRATRLDLARWLVAKENPVTSRVLANRLWKLMFGQGLVKSLEDFGSQGATPSHPELLDYLAADLVAGGWNVKAFVKQLVMTQAYRRSSVVSPELRQRDPFNTLVAAQGRFRLDAEMIRDGALATSGLLVRELGGKSVKPYQPAGYWAHLNFPAREWQKETGPNVYRRSLYTYWCRTFPHPGMLAFDAPSREECVVDRPRSNTPLAALVLLNDPTYVEAARVLAERTIREGGADVPSRLAYLFKQALQREPLDAEAKFLATTYERHLESYKTEPAAAQALTKVGDKPAPTDLDVAELAAWTSVCRVVLNLHESVTRQ